MAQINLLSGAKWTMTTFVLCIFAFAQRLSKPGSDYFSFFCLPNCLLYCK